MRRLFLWFRASRPEFLTASLMPVLVGGALVYRETGVIAWPLWLLTALGMALLHMAANLANDYYDHLSGNDDINTSFVRPFTGGSRFIQRGLISPRLTLLLSLSCLGGGGLIGAYLFWLRGWPILALGLVGGLSGFFYTARPVQLCYRGLGEIFLALDFGLLPVLGTYFVQTSHFAWSAFWISWPVGLLITAVLWINQFPDYAADCAVGKRHWVVRLGTARASYVYAFMVWLAFAMIAVAVLVGKVSGLIYLGFLPLPLAVRAVTVAFTRHSDPAALKPANADTVLLHLAVSVLLALGLILGRLL